MSIDYPKDKLEWIIIDDSKFLLSGDYDLYSSKMNAKINYNDTSNKLCKSCDTRKPLDQFHKNKYYPDAN